MNIITSFPITSTLLLVAFSIAGCSSGGGGGAAAPVTSYSGSTTPAAIDADNAEAIGKSAGEAVQIANSSTDLPYGISVDSNTADNLTEINNTIISNLDILTLPSAVDISAQMCSSGTASSTDPGNVQSGPVDITVTFSNCAFKYSDINSDITISGTLKMHFDDFAEQNADFSITYTNFKVTDANGTTTINMSMVCTSGSACVFNSDFVGFDGQTHRVSNFRFSGSTSTGGYYGTAIFYHSTFGSVSITATGITYGNCGSYPDGGSVAFDSTDGSFGTIIFASDCSVSGTWNNGVTGSAF